MNDSDAGDRLDPIHDPRNRNEDFATFQSLVPKEHIFAEWLMPDNTPNTKAKHSYTVDGAVVIDNVTKLRWQRVLPELYPGCTANYEYVGRLRGPGTGCTWEEAPMYCSRPDVAKQLGPGTWRVPTKIELESLVDASRVNAVDPLFDDFPIDCVWSSSPVPNPDGVKLAWVVDFMEGTNSDSARFKGCRVRCVSSAKQTGGSAPEYEFTADTALDKRTQLVWQRAGDSATRTWREAIDYCDKNPLDGGGWRLPSLKELLTIVDSSRHFPAANTKAFLNTQYNRYWSATEYLDGRERAYQVDFAKGGNGIEGTIADEHYVRCVR